MRKIYVAFIACVLSVSALSAAGYPDQINDGKAFQSFQSLEHLYEKIYQDTNRFDVETVKTRVCADPAIDCETDVNIENFADFLATVRISTSLSKTEQERWRRQLNQQIVFENTLLTLENNLIRHNALNLAYGDGDSAGKNAPFDLLLALDDIDELFFGEKLRPFAPQLLNDEPNEVTETWWDQRKEKLEKSADFSVDDYSLSAIAQHTAKLMAEVNAHSLICSVPTKGIFEYPFCTAPLGTPSFLPKAFSIPFSKDLPEFLEIPEPEQGFDLALESILKNANCQSQDLAKAAPQNISLVSGIDQLNLCNKARQRALQQKIIDYQLQSYYTSLSADYTRTTAALDNLQGFMTFFNDYSSQMKTFWENLLKKHPKQ